MFKISLYILVKSFVTQLVIIFIYILWWSKIWARDLDPGTTFHQQYARGEEITEDRCN